MVRHARHEHPTDECESTPRKYLSAGICPQIRTRALSAAGWPTDVQTKPPTLQHTATYEAAGPHFAHFHCVVSFGVTHNLVPRHEFTCKKHAGKAVNG